MRLEIMSVVEVILMLLCCLGAGGTLRLPPGENGKVLNPYWSAGVVLEAAFQPGCSAIFIHDAKDGLSTDFIPVSPWGTTVFKVAANNQDANMTMSQLSLVIVKARQLRQVCGCVTVVVVSDNATFLTIFAECSLKGRLLVWSTRLLAVTRLPLPQLRLILSSYWTFSMMNAMLVVLNERVSKPSVYVNMPYSVSGAIIVKTAIWTTDKGLQILNCHLFPEKFNKATVNVTALSYRPYWNEDEEQSGDNTGVTRYSGSDAMMLWVIADVLNFTFSVLPVSTWDQISTSFSMPTPSLTTNWESLFVPLALEVWVSVLVVLFLVPPCLFMITRPEVGEELNHKLTIGDSAEIAVGTLLGQGTKKQLPESISGQLLLVTWLVFAFIVSNVYRGNLTAALTLPKYPPRPETLEQLIKVVDKVMMPTYGENFKQFFKQSDSAVYQTLSNIMEVVPSAEYCLRQTVDKKEGCMDDYRYLQQLIADNFTLVDGRTKIYIGRERIMLAPGAWPIPHDAPYKPQLDLLMIHINEAGLYEKWINDMILRAQDDSRKRQREEQEKEREVATQSTPETSENQALTLRHMQGPLLIVALGLFVSMIVFMTELMLKLYRKETA